MNRCVCTYVRICVVSRNCFGSNRSRRYIHTMSRVTKGSQPSQGLIRIPLEPIGFSVGNRGGLGISSFRVHEVAWDCIANKTKPDLNELRDTPHQRRLLDNASDELKADRADADTAEPVSHSYRCLHCNIDMGLGGRLGGPRPLPPRR